MVNFYVRKCKDGFDINNVPAKFRDEVIAKLK